MAAIFSAICSSCGKTHHCALNHPDIPHAGTICYFECPETGQSATVALPDDWSLIGQGNPPARSRCD